MLLMQNDDPVAGGGLPVIHITQAQYDANPSAYNDPNVLVHITNATGGNLQGSDVSYDSTLKFNNIGDIATKAIAKVEPSDTALYAHAVGTYFINKDGEYCVTDSAIAVNGTITKGTNCHVVTVADELSSINSNLSAFLTVTTDTVDNFSVASGQYGQITDVPVPTISGYRMVDILRWNVVGTNSSWCAPTTAWFSSDRTKYNVQVRNTATSGHDVTNATITTRFLFMKR